MKQYKFRRWLRNWITQFDSNEAVKESCIGRDYPNQEPEPDKSLNIRVWFANGGRVVQVNRYDVSKDRTFSGMYVITHTQNFGEEIDKIISLEGLRG